VRARNVRVVFRKELLDVLRDRRTILSMVVFPIVSIPILMLGIPKLFSSQIRKAAETLPRIAILGEEHDPALGARLRVFKVETVSDAAEAIRQGRIDAAVVFPPALRETLRQGKKAEIQVLRDSTELSSQVAYSAIERVVGAYEKEILKERNVDLALLDPIAIRGDNVASDVKQRAQIAAMIIPYLLIFLCLVGATYVAIDLTAGERERGTLETLLVSPAGRLEIIAGKLVTVFTSSMMSAALSMASLAATQAIFGSEVKVESPLRGQGPVLSLEVPLQAMGLLLALMVPLAAMFSALTMALAMFARSYKEAMTYLSPMMLVAILPTLLPMLPGFKPGAGVALIPMANVSVAMSEVLKGQYSWGFLGATFATTAAVAALSVMWATLQFRRESVLFRS
jgi:sodium transport system permease protein